MHPSVLIVGHDEPRVDATRGALAAGRLTNPVHACRDLPDVTAYVLGHEPYRDRDLHPLPAVVVTDLRLDRGDGLAVVRLFRSHLALRRTPVIVVGDDATENEIAEAHHLGAAAFLTRGVADHVLLEVIRDAGTPWALGRVEQPA